MRLRMFDEYKKTGLRSYYAGGAGPTDRMQSGQGKSAKQNGMVQLRLAADDAADDDEPTGFCSCRAVPQT